MATNKQSKSAGLPKKETAARTSKASGSTNKQTAAAQTGNAKQANRAKRASEDDEMLAGVDAPVCDCNVIHESTVAAVRKGLANDVALTDAAELFKVLGDPTRLKIVSALLLEEICVCDVAAVLGMSQPAVSHHLKVLKAARLVKYRRDGKQIYYSVDDEHVTNVFYQGMLHATHK